MSEPTPQYLIPPPVEFDLPLEWLLTDEDLESVGDVDGDW
jgi:hypothetical protein